MTTFLYTVFGSSVAGFENAQLCKPTSDFKKAFKAYTDAVAMGWQVRMYDEAYTVEGSKGLGLRFANL